MDNINMDLKEIEWDDIDWIDLAQDKCQCRAREHSNESLGCIKCWEVLE
jgi:hypothetical protein